MTPLLEGVRVRVDPYCPTWTAEPTRGEIWHWRLWGRWLGRPRPQRERVIYEMGGEFVMSPETLQEMKALELVAKP